EAGDAETGVTIMQMDEGLDTGDMLLDERIAIEPQDTTGTLHDKLAALGGRLIVEALEMAACGGLAPVRQPAEGITYAHKIDKAEAAIDWRLQADVIERRIRAFDPFPGAVAQIHGEPLKIWRARALMQGHVSAAPGMVVSVDEHCIGVACGQGRLEITELQRAGGKRLAAREFLHGFPLQPGMAFEAAGAG
ncbi:MAG TPA: methionyl-tRNA formyltransferase, partial [Ramlibacter sp.]|nr:methionyl-tRNA formyltransferase [Ramlibacter sp.]